ncbi:hypothetical protein EGT74_04385 [Chitinophaga lutea]|uniref:Uncharacterized protein n=1 Tax=Chitinophaga lutea TaxID=2488634 RepID=A0A3N4PXX0_9BACT|nr:hypothetical protein [Chitinophaga lutea]RPE12788.1 hypothetical protein EGT74_04385 [Chitinophaga lutea]
MTHYRYFTQEGDKFHLRSNTSAAIVRSVLCLAMAAGIYFLIPPEKKIGLWGAGLFVFFALINLLRSTKKLTIDVAAKTVVHKNNALTAEATYRFDEFVQFYVLRHSYLFRFIMLDCTAFLVFGQEGREKQVPVVVGLFSARPAQNAVNEMSAIMGFEAA